MGSTGKRREPSADTTSVLDLLSMSPWDSGSEIDRLRDAMGQTGLEAGDPDATPRDKLYVNTGKSFCINTYLMTDGKTYDAPGTDWGGLISERWVQDAIKQIDSGMRPLPEDVKVARFMTGSGLGKMLGMDGLTDRNIRMFIRKLERDPSAAADFKEGLRGTSYTHKAYTSTTYSGTHGSYGENPVRLNIIASKGTPAIITANRREHEILLGRGQKYDFSRASFRVETLPSGKKQLVIDVKM